MRPLLSACGLALVGAALAPGVAGAHSLVRPAGELVSYTSADATSLNTLSVGIDGGRIAFRDPSVDGGMDPGSCAPGEITEDANAWIIQVFCPSGGVRRLRIDLGEREDSATVSAPIAATIIGGPGADRLTGGEQPDELSGDDGNDTLAGGGGADVVSGGQGADALDGGGGGDRLVSRDGVADSVRCGDGEDSVDADTLDQVAGDCENVSRTFAAPPEDGVDVPGRPRVEVGAFTLQRVSRSRGVRVYATSSERGTISASGFLEIAGLAVPVKVSAKRVRVGGGGVALGYRISPRRWPAVRRALRRGRRVSLRLGVVATDLAGNTRRADAPRIVLAGSSAAGASARAAHPEPGDVDGDEVRDEVDNCPTVKNGSQVDTDGDLAGDACDGDDDADGVPDGSDNCRVDHNPGQENTVTPGDRYGDACEPVDSDQPAPDGIIDDDDNCDFVANPDQSDLDGDDKGDACDRDDDGDFYDDGYDNCPTVYNFDQLDRDADGLGTACDADEPVVTIPPGVDDTTPPRLRLVVAARQRLAAVTNGLVVRLRCSEACSATSELVLARRLSKRLGLGRSRVVATGSARLDAAGTTYVFVRFTRRVRRVLFRQPQLRALLATGAVDGAGNPRQLSRRLRLYR